MGEARLWSREVSRFGSLDNCTRILTTTLIAPHFEYRDGMVDIELEHGEANVKTNGLTVEEQVQKAYADAYGIDNGFEDKERCLSFLTSEWVEPEHASSLVEYIGEYNAFNPDTVSGKFYTLSEEADVDFKVAVGREGSPVLYFATNEPEKIRRVFRSYADEFGEVEPPDVSGKEQYRSEDSFVEEHSMCQHDEPPVPPGYEARGDTENGLTYIRAWWD
jgi:hypothetical protein